MIHYQIVRLLGHGGFGDVYQVNDLSDFGTKYAMKTEYLNAQKQALEREV